MVKTMAIISGKRLSEYTRDPALRPPAALQMQETSWSKQSSQSKNRIALRLRLSGHEFREKGVSDILSEALLQLMLVNLLEW